MVVVEGWNWKGWKNVGVSGPLVCTDMETGSWSLPLTFTAVERCDRKKIKEAWTKRRAKKGRVFYGKI